ncbi:mitotic spindle assembly checkpoint protein MAD2B-like [Artemia franciscana]|uniref:mitotic spindle assembly checkpoint protein MAD2B-like n=1 Tax=Artemia franciscana TaxID=6661 RepID=UPI0032DAB912
MRHTVEEELVMMDFNQIKSCVIVELLEVIFHEVIYLWNVYPKGSFLRTKNFDCLVMQCSHPSVMKYISDSVSSMKNSIEDDKVTKVSCKIIDKGEKVIQSVVLDIGKVQKRNEDPGFINLEQDLRTLILKLTSCAKPSQYSPGDHSFRIEVETFMANFREMVKNNKIHSKDEPQWIVCNEMDVSDAGSRLIVPVHSVSSSLCNIQLYIEDYKK